MPPAPAAELCCSRSGFARIDSPSYKGCHRLARPPQFTVRITVSGRVLLRDKPVPVPGLRVALDCLSIDGSGEVNLPEALELYLARSNRRRPRSVLCP